MRVIIERGKRKYEVVQCGRRCSFGKPYIGDWGNVEYCDDGCHCPKWWRNAPLASPSWLDGGLREITEETK